LIVNPNTAAFLVCPVFSFPIYTMEQAAQRSCGCPLPGSVQGQVGWGSEQPRPMEGVPAHGRGVGTR